VDSGVDVRDASAAPIDAPFLRGDDRREHIMSVVQRHNDVQSCWDEALQREGEHANESFHATLDVDERGIAHVTLDTVNDPSLADCVRIRLRGHEYGPGEAMTVTAEYNLAGAGGGN
jgi:hypothetical protein